MRLICLDINRTEPKQSEAFQSYDQKDLGQSLDARTLACYSHKTLPRQPQDPVRFLFFPPHTNTMSLLEQIKNNEITELRIDSMPKEAFEGKKKEDLFITALGKNTSITSVRLEGDFLACLKADVRSKVLEAVGKLPSLRSVYLGDCLLLAPDLTDLLINGKTVTILHLHDVCLQGAPELVDALETILRHHVTLKDFEMSNCMASNQSVDMDKLKEAADRSHCSSGGMATSTAQTSVAKSA